MHSSHRWFDIPLGCFWCLMLGQNTDSAVCTNLLTDLSRPEFDMRAKAVEEVLLRCDYHGCKVAVTQSKCPSYVGLSGIIAQDSKEVFKIITKGDKLKSMSLRCKRLILQTVYKPLCEHVFECYYHYHYWSFYDMISAVPKKNTIFTFRLGSYDVKIFGNNFNFRPMDRINRKFKGINTIDLWCHHFTLTITLWLMSRLYSYMESKFHNILIV